MLQLVLEGGLLVRPLHILSPVHWVGVEPTTLRDETSGRTTTPVVPTLKRIVNVDKNEVSQECPSGFQTRIWKYYIAIFE